MKSKQCQGSYKNSVFTLVFLYFEPIYRYIAKVAKWNHFCLLFFLLFYLILINLSLTLYVHKWFRWPFWSVCRTQICLHSDISILIHIWNCYQIKWKAQNFSRACSSNYQPNSIELNHCKTWKMISYLNLRKNFYRKLRFWFFQLKHIHLFLNQILCFWNYVQKYLAIIIASGAWNKSWLIASLSCLAQTKVSSS